MRIRKTGLIYKGQYGWLPVPAQVSAQEEVPLFEATYAAGTTIFRRHYKKATKGSPTNCAIARAFLEKGALYVLIGESIYNFIVWPPTPEHPFVHALHYTKSSAAVTVQKRFDADRTLPSQDVILPVPPPTHTLAKRVAQDKKYRDAVERGDHVPVERGPNKNARGEGETRVLPSLGA